MEYHSVRPICHWNIVKIGLCLAWKEQSIGAIETIVGGHGNGLGAVGNGGTAVEVRIGSPGISRRIGVRATPCIDAYHLRDAAATFPRHHNPKPPSGEFHECGILGLSAFNFTGHMPSARVSRESQS